MVNRGKKDLYLGRVVRKGSTVLIGHVPIHPKTDKRKIGRVVLFR